MSKEIIRIPDSELEIMQIIWSVVPPISTKMVRESFNEKKERDLNISTIQTLLNRLIKKGFIKAQKAGKEKVYYPIISQEEYQRFEANRFINKVFENSFSDLVSTLYRDNKISKKDIDEISEWFNNECREV